MSQLDPSSDETWSADVAEAVRAAESIEGWIEKARGSGEVHCKLLKMIFKS